MAHADAQLAPPGAGLPPAERFVARSDRPRESLTARFAW